jgi:hypothetical protein
MKFDYSDAMNFSEEVLKKRYLELVKITHPDNP